jgi:cephalosporin-C deacetylase-like acetyl esterase
MKNANHKMTPSSTILPLFLAVAVCFAVPVMAQTDPAASAARPVGVVARTTNPTGIYHVGENINVRVQVRDGATDAVNQVEYTAKLHGAKVVASGKLELTNHVAGFQTSLNEPGSLLFTVSGTTTSGQKFSTFAGATADYKKIQWPLPLPDDFDSFWDGKLAESKKLPLNPKIEPVALANEPAIDYYKLTLDNINGSHVFGQLARPKKSGKFPAILLVQYAGVYPLKRENVTGLARDGWLVLNISAHDVPFNLPESEFQKLADTTLKDYTAIGQTNRETSYFLRMFLGCQRAAEYLMTRDDWNGKILVVKGTSQGGLQSIVTAALCPKVSAIMILEPAGCGNTAQQIGRGWGWPYWQAHANGPEAEKIMTTSRYFDAINFAHRVKCSALVGPGLMETTCPASNVFAMCNLLGGPVEVVVLPEAGHQASKTDRHGETPFNQRAAEWLKALKADQPVPVIK